MTSQDSNIPKATYRRLGESGLRVSNPILGAMSIGDKRWQPWVIEEDEALPLLKAAYDRGINVSPFINRNLTRLRTMISARDMYR